MTAPSLKSELAPESATPPLLDDAPNSEIRLHRFSVKDYHRMGKFGALSADDRVELLEGLVVDMNPIYAPHAYSVEKTRICLEQRLPKGWIVRVQQPVTLRRSEPQPDVTVARGSHEDFVERHPGPKEIALLVEVADTTLRKDRTMKARIYAAAGVPEYWIVNLVDRHVEVHRNPKPARKGARAGYDFLRAVDANGAMELRLGDEKLGEFAVAHLLPHSAAQ